MIDFYINRNITYFEKYFFLDAPLTQLFNIGDLCLLFHKYKVFCDLKLVIAFQFQL